MPAAAGHVALGAWSGGRYLHYGEPLDDERLVRLLTPDDAVRTVLTADAYGAGEADALVGRAIAARPRGDVFLVGAVGHDFYEGEREGPKGFPRFTDPRLRGPEGYAAYLRMATERSLERLGTDHLDLLLLHNPDRTGYTSDTVWDALRALRDEGLTRQLGVAPGPANGFTLDVIECFERFGDLLDQAWSSSARWSRGRASSCSTPPPTTASTSSPASSTTAGCSGTTSCPGTGSRPATTAGSARRAGSSAAAAGSTRCGRSPSGTG
jgi:hypothetical protein